MQNATYEVKLVTGTGHDNSFAQFSTAPRRTTASRSVDILDAAFADYRRVDNPESKTSSTAHAGVVTKALIADITAQLDILDRQRQQLAALLHDSAI